MVISSIFNPEKYQALLQVPGDLPSPLAPSPSTEWTYTNRNPPTSYIPPQLLADRYGRTGDPLQLLGKGVGSLCVDTPNPET